ncbi:MerR family transcriptional regulator [Cellulosimicrobium terreum]|nr:MerR family transcriptional regulator [Cellulosimicrobium terreum]
MAWSTREVADLAGTTVNTVRHYHSLGLVDEPERWSNGYKQYRVSHLVALIRVRRLVELGVPLAQVADINASSPGALRDLDAELQAGIDRLNRVRADVAAILAAHAPLDTPRGFESVASRLSEADRSLIHVLTRLCDQDQRAELSLMIAQEPESIRRAFDALTDDADDVARQRVAHEIANSGANWRGVGGRGAVGRALADALWELYNPAQHDVVRRAAALPPTA